ncbi:hypothetical protein, partial [Sanguibacter sp. 26GB23]
SQIALVLLNKGNNVAEFEIEKYLQQGQWKSQLSDKSIRVNDTTSSLVSQVAPHDVQVWLYNGVITQTQLLEQLSDLMRNK